MKLPIPDGKFDAFLYDCDGTLVDSMPLHYEAWKHGLLAAGATWTMPVDYFYGSAGKTAALVVRELNQLYSDSLDADSVEKAKEAFYHKGLLKLKPFPDVGNHLKHASESGVPTGVVSGSARLAVHRSLEVTGLLAWAGTIVAAEDVKHGKPAPDCFLLAAERLGVDPERCLVFEDGESGIQAAKACGMAVVRVDARRSVESIP